MTYELRPCYLVLVHSMWSYIWALIKAVKLNHPLSLMWKLWLSRPLVWFPSSIFCKLDYIATRYSIMFASVAVAYIYISIVHVCLCTCMCNEHIYVYIYMNGCSYLYLVLPCGCRLRSNLKLNVSLYSDRAHDIFCFLYPTFEKIYLVFIIPYRRCIPNVYW